MTAVQNPPVKPVRGRGPSVVTRLLESRRLGWGGLALGLLAPFVTATPYALNVMTSAAVFVMLTVGLNIVVGYCGLLDLGFAAFLAVGAYTGGVLATRLELRSWPPCRPSSWQPWWPEW